MFGYAQKRLGGRSNIDLTLWQMDIDALSSTIATYGLEQFHEQMKFDLAPHRNFLKLACIKMAFSLSLYQSV
jgi:hypothetical protein